MKKISVALCVDKKRGTLFFGKRQSRDKLLIEEFVNSYLTHGIYVNEYSSPLFQNYEGIHITSDPIGDCPDGGMCFIENIDIKAHLDIIDMIVLYNWNVSYPSDSFFDIGLRKNGYKLLGKRDIVGNSHDVITKETYKK